MRLQRKYPKVRGWFKRNKGVGIMITGNDIFGWANILAIGKKSEIIGVTVCDTSTPPNENSVGEWRAKVMKSNFKLTNAYLVWHSYHADKFMVWDFEDCDLNIDFTQQGESPMVGLQDL